MNAGRIAPAALDAFLLALRAEGFAVGVGECVRARALVERLGPEHPACADWQSLGPWLAPIVCRRPSEQEAFARVLANWRAPGPDASAAGTAAGPPPPPVAAARRLQRRLARARWLPVLLALALLAGLLLLGRLPTTAPTGSVAVEPAPPAVVAEPERWLEQQAFRLRRALATPPERAPLIALGWALAIVFALRFARRRHALARRFGVRGAAELARLGTAAGTRYLDTPALRQHLQALRLHQQQPTRRLDVPATLAATLRAGGRPVPVYDTRPLAPEYLLLAPLGGRRDQRADLADELDARLREEQVHVERYSYLSTPRWLRPVPATGGRELALDALAARAAGSHLLLVDDGAVLIDPLRGRPADWTGPLERFALRVLLTPVPPAEWGARERALDAAGWTVLHLATADIGRLADALRVGLRADGGLRLPPRARTRTADTGNRRSSGYPALLALDESAWLDRRAPAPERIARLLAELRGFLGPEAFEWLGALAVFPRLHPALTRHLGARLTDAAGRPLAADERRLAALARLPWLRRAFMPDWLRLALIGTLPAARETAVRDALTAALLLGQDAPDGGLSLEVVTGHAELRTVLVELLRAGRGAGGRERILLRFLRGEPLEVSAPRAFVERLRRVAASPVGYWLAVAAASAAAWWLWPADGLLARLGIPAVDLTRLAEGVVSALPWFDPAVLVLAVAGVWHWLAGQLRGRAVPGGRAIDAALAAVALLGLPMLALLVAIPLAGPGAPAHATEQQLPLATVASVVASAVLKLPGAPLRYVLAPTLLAFLALWLRRLELPDCPMRPSFANALIRPPETHRRLALRLTALVALAEALFWAGYGSVWIGTATKFEVADVVSAATVLTSLGAGPVRAFVLAGAVLLALRTTLGLAWSELPPLLAAIVLARVAAGLAGDCLGVLAVTVGATGRDVLFLYSFVPGLAFAWPATALGLAVALARSRICPLDACRGALAAALPGALAGPLSVLAIVGAGTNDWGIVTFLFLVWLCAAMLQSLPAGAILIGLLRASARWREARRVPLRANLTAAALPALVVGPATVFGMFALPSMNLLADRSMLAIGPATTLATATFAFLALRTLLRAYGAVHMDANTPAKQSIGNQKALFIFLGILSSIPGLCLAIYTPALPEMALYFNTTDATIRSSQTWFAIANVIIQILFVFIYAPISDRYGRKYIMMAGLIVFSAGSTGCTLAGSMDHFIIWRIIQGLGACVGPVVARTIIEDVFDNEQRQYAHRAVWIGIIASPAVALFVSSIFLRSAGIISVSLLLTLTGFLMSSFAYRCIPETRPSFVSTKNITRSTISNELRKLLTNRIFMLPVLASSFSLAGAFAYLTDIAFVFNHTLGMTTGVDVWLTINAAMLAVIFYWDNKLVKQMDPRSRNVLTVRALLVRWIATLILLSMAYADHAVRWPIMMLLFIYHQSLGLILAKLQADAMHVAAGMQSTASSLYGALLNSGVLLGTALPLLPLMPDFKRMATTIFCCATLACICSWQFVQRLSSAWQKLRLFKAQVWLALSRSKQIK